MCGMCGVCSVWCVRCVVCVCIVCGVCRVFDVCVLVQCSLEERSYARFSHLLSMIRAPLWLPTLHAWWPGCHQGQRPSWASPSPASGPTPSQEGLLRWPEPAVSCWTVPIRSSRQQLVPSAVDATIRHRFQGSGRGHCGVLLTPILLHFCSGLTGDDSRSRPPCPVTAQPHAPGPLSWDLQGHLPRGSHCALQECTSDLSSLWGVTPGAVCWGTPPPLFLPWTHTLRTGESSHAHLGTSLCSLPGWALCSPGSGFHPDGNTGVHLPDCATCGKGRSAPVCHPQVSPRHRCRPPSAPPAFPSLPTPSALPQQPQGPRQLGWAGLREVCGSSVRWRGALVRVALTQG